MEEISTEPASTQISTIRLLMKAAPMLACCQAVLKFSRYSQLEGGVITLVAAYSSLVLNAVVMQETMGTSEMKAAMHRNAYFTMFKSSCFALMVAISFITVPPYLPAGVALVALAA